MATNDLDRVVPLNRLDDFEVADGDPDVRGWSVVSAEGKKIGRTLSEEELMVRKRERAAGAVEVEKHVETEHVRQAVPLTHEEVVVERHAITDPTAAPGAIGAEEVRVPLTAEEAVVEKRVVPKEELVVRKQEVTENEVVEADLRRERAEIRRDGAPGPHDGDR